MATKAELEQEIQRLSERLAEHYEQERMMLGKGDTVEFAALIGLHDLDAVDIGSVKLARWEGSDDMEDCNLLWFRLDGVIYGCIEDPSDGYRSSMRDLVTWDRSMVNTFAPCRVLARHRTKSDYHEADILEFIDVVTGKTVLEVGTDRSDDYYPSYVSSFTPENMAPNASTTPDTAS